ncbi:fungal-specific transcription factor domain-containing protein [Aspergillus unguis]
MSTQVLCKSAEELFQDNEIRIRVMDFFRPYMNFAEEIPMLPSTYYPMVDKGTADRYLTAYLTSVNSLFPVVSPPVLTASFNSFYDTGSSNDPVLVCTIYTVLALGSRQDDAQDEAQRLFGAAWELYGRVVSTPYLPSVQALLLMALELMNSHKDGQAMLAVGTAVRIAQSIGMHRRLSSHTQPRERRFIAQEYSLRTRIWWVCYCLDKKLSFDTGRPSAINDIECDVDTPAEMAMLLHSGTTSDQDEFLKGLVQLCQIQSAVVSRLFCRTDHEAEYPHLVHEIEALDGQLLAWKAALPRSLQLDEQISVAHSDLVLVKPSFLHCIYYNTMLVIHRAALFGEIPLQPHQRAQPRMVAADAVCLNSARSLGRLVNEMLIAPSSWPVSRWMTPLVMNVIFTLYVGVMRNPAQWTSESDVALINSLRVCFSKINKVPFVIASFDELCSSLTRAIAVMKRRSQLMAETAPGSQPGSDLPVDGVLQDPVGDVNPDIDFRFGDFFGVYGGPDPLISMQMWPVNLDEAIDS